MLSSVTFFLCAVVICRKGLSLPFASVHWGGLSLDPFLVRFVLFDVPVSSFFPEVGVGLWSLRHRGLGVTGSVLRGYIVVFVGLILLSVLLRLVPVVLGVVVIVSLAWGLLPLCRLVCMLLSVVLFLPIVYILKYIVVFAGLILLSVLLRLVPVVLTVLLAVTPP